MLAGLEDPQLIEQEADADACRRGSSPGTVTETRWRGGGAVPEDSAVHRPSSLHERYRFPGEIISHAVWLDYRSLLSYWDVEEFLAERGIAVSYETIRRWCRPFGQPFADGVRRRRPRPGDNWHGDEVQLKINGRKHWLWQEVDQEGIVLDILVRGRRNQEAAEAFLRPVVGRENSIRLTRRGRRRGAVHPAPAAR